MTTQILDAPASSLANGENNKWMDEVIRVCEAASHGDYEQRMPYGDATGRELRLITAVNHLIDVNDAFIREAGAALDHAAKGKFYRRVILRGLPGCYRYSAILINNATKEMQINAKALEDARHKRIELADEFDHMVREIVNSVAAAAQEMSATAKSLAATALSTTQETEAAATACDSTVSSVQTVASAAEELSNSASEVGRQMTDSSKVAENAVSQTEQTNTTVSSLAEASDRIGKVVKLISTIARQTNLLALNATIEAARAGEAGKGFAVVASEVKHLAQQTGSATDEITNQVKAIQEATKMSVDAIHQIRETIGRVSDISVAISRATDEQRCATRDVSAAIHTVSNHMTNVSGNITRVSSAAKATNEAAARVADLSANVSMHVEELRSGAEKFTTTLRSDK